MFAGECTMAGAFLRLEVGPVDLASVDSPQAAGPCELHDGHGQNNLCKHRDEHPFGFHIQLL